MITSREILQSQRILDPLTMGEVAEEFKSLLRDKKFREVVDLSVKMAPSKQKYALLAFSYLGLKEWKNLIDSCDKGLEIDSAQPQFLNLKGKALGKLGKYHEQILLLTEAIKLNSMVASYHRNLGSAYYNIQRYQLAIDEYSKAIDLQPDNIMNYHNKGTAYLKNEQYVEAKECFEKALEKNPNLALTYSWLGDCERKLQNFDEAIRLYQKAYEISGKDVYQKEIQKIEKEKQLSQQKGTLMYGVNWLKNKIF